MMHEVRSIPPAPRRVALRPLVAHRWPLLAIGGSLVVIGTLAAWLMFLQSGGMFSLGPLLDHGPSAGVTGRVTAVYAPLEWSGQRWQQVYYDFHYDMSNLSGCSFVAAGKHAIGDPIEVEVLVADRNISRAAGGVLYQDRVWLRARFWIAAMTMPGALLLLTWLAGFLKLRRVLVHGDVSVGRVTALVRVLGVLPEMLRVTYEFRDRRAIARKHSHWVRTHGKLGWRLIHQIDMGAHEPMPVLHDRQRPRWSRMLLPEDFLPQTSQATLPGDDNP